MRSLVSLALISSAFAAPACSRSTARTEERSEAKRPLEARVGGVERPTKESEPVPPQETATAPASVSKWNIEKVRASATPPLPTDGPRVYAKMRNVWIYPEPDATKEWIGFLWVGNSVKIKNPKPISGIGCGFFFYAIEPQGYVCVDGQHATLDAKDATLVAEAPFAPRLDTPWPHRYGESLGTERWFDLPGAAPEFPGLARAVHEDRHAMRPKSTIAYSTESTVNGKSYLLTADYAWVEKAKVTPYPEVTFEGVALDGATQLPLAFFRTEDRQEFRASPDGSFAPSGAKFARLSWTRLTGKEQVFSGEKYLEAPGGRWLKATDAVIPSPQATTPWGAPVGGEDTTGKTPKGRATWLEASIRGGWLIAYEGTRPVFTTLISAGRGGEPVPGKSLIATASTPVGTYPITGKFATATMVAPNEYIHSDVPWAQNFHGPHALHAAYWHDEFGDLKSGGCVNVAPIDGKHLYEWTEPSVPPGWHGVRWLPWQGPSTLMVVHK